MVETRNDKATIYNHGNHKAPCKIVANDILKYVFLFSIFRENKAQQTISMECQKSYFSGK